MKLTPGADRNAIFDQPRAILVEGADDQAIVAALIRHEGLEDFQVHDMRGNKSWGQRLETIIRQPEFSVTVKALGLIKDADANPNAAFDSCVGVLRRYSLPEPRGAGELAHGAISVAVMIAPSVSRQGAIEDLCMDSFDEAHLACVRSYFACLGRTLTVTALMSGWAA